MLDLFIPTYPAHFGSVFASVTLIIILFEGGLGLPLNVLNNSFPRIILLTLLNFLVTMIGAGLATSYLTGLDLKVSLIFGAILGCTAVAIIIPLVREIGLQKESQTILSIESAATNVLGFIVTFAMLEAYQKGEMRIGLMIGRMFLSFGVATLIGLAGGMIWTHVLPKARVLKNSSFTSPAFAFVIFGVVEWLSCSGYIAVLVFSITLGSAGLLKPMLPRYISFCRDLELRETEGTFFSEIAFLLRSLFFVFVGASIQLTELHAIYLGLLITLVIFFIRIPVSWFVIGKKVPAMDAAFVSVMAPRGIAVAALASIVLREGIAGGEILRNMAFAVVLFSIAFVSVFVFLFKNNR